jgi:hypothetical protein
VPEFKGTNIFHMPTLLCRIFLAYFMEDNCVLLIKFNKILSLPICIYYHHHHHHHHYHHYHHHHYRISHFSATAGKHSPILGHVINRNRLGGLIYNLTLILLTWKIWRAPNNARKSQMEFNSAFKGLKTFLQLNMFQELQIFAFVRTYSDAG